jgi:hypothetical protein
MSGAIGMYKLMSGIERSRRELHEHEIFRSINDLESVRVFMEHHVFAVWDFMSLVKQLQRQLTCVDVPWHAVGDTTARRLINEIVMHEESDDLGAYGYTSHFELYVRAMKDAGARCDSIDRFVEGIRCGESVETALSLARAPRAAAAFVINTFKLIRTNEPHIVAAAFTFGREEPIPNMFRKLLTSFGDGQKTEHLGLLNLYLNRHIGIDESDHAPMAIRMLAGVCDDNLSKWDEARQAAVSALESRLALWSGVVADVALVRAGVRRSHAA